MKISLIKEAVKAHGSGTLMFATLLLGPSLLAGDVIAPMGTAPQPAPVAQTQSQPGYSPGVADVVKMLDAKVDPEVVKTYIKASTTAYNPNAEEIVALKRRGVPDDVLSALIQRGAEIRSQPVASAPTPQATAPAPSAPEPSPYATSTAPDYLYDYGYPGASYGGYPYYSYYYPVGFPYWSSWWWNDWWYPWPYYSPFYCGWYGYHHYPYWGYGSVGYRDHGYAYNGPWRDHGGGLRGWASDGRRPTWRNAPPYTGPRSGFVRSAPSATRSPSMALSAPSARSGSFGGRQSFSSAPSYRANPYAGSGGFRSSGTYRSYGGSNGGGAMRSYGSTGSFRGSAPTRLGGGGGSGFRSGGGFGGSSGFRGGGGGGFGGHGGGGGGGFGGHSGGGGGRR